MDNHCSAGARPDEAEQRVRFPRLQPVLIAAALALVVGGDAVKRDSWDVFIQRAQEQFMFRCIQTNSVPVCQRLWRARGPFG